MALVVLANQLLEVSQEFQKIAKEKKKTKQSQKGDCVFPVGHPKNKSNKAHYPINSLAQARNALARASQHSKVPSWFKGTLQQLVSAVRSKVHKKYPSIKLTEKSKNPGKG